jgi:hypothetical protein
MKNQKEMKMLGIYKFKVTEQELKALVAMEVNRLASDLRREVADAVADFKNELDQLKECVTVDCAMITKNTAEARLNKWQEDLDLRTKLLEAQVKNHVTLEQTVRYANQLIDRIDLSPRVQFNGKDAKVEATTV